VQEMESKERLELSCFPPAAFIPMAQTPACQMPSILWIRYNTGFISKTGLITKAMKS